MLKVAMRGWTILIGWAGTILSLGNLSLGTWLLVVGLIPACGSTVEGHSQVFWGCWCHWEVVGACLGLSYIWKSPESQQLRCWSHPSQSAKKPQILHGKCWDCFDATCAVRAGCKASQTEVLTPQVVGSGQESVLEPGQEHWKLLMWIC